jgi:hypothetical protein
MRDASVGLIVAAEAAAVIAVISNAAKAMRLRVPIMVLLLSCVSKMEVGSTLTRPR